MLALYLACLGFGATMILVSLVLGGGGDKDLHADHDAQVDHEAGGDASADADQDADADADGTVDHEAGADGQADAEGAADAHADHDHGQSVGADNAWWLPLVSVRFWTFAAAAFGLGGTLMTFLAVPWLLTLLVAGALGLGSGYGAARFFAALRSDEVSGATDPGRFAGEEARVVLTIRPGAQGKIALDTRAGRIELMARTRDPAPIEVGGHVLVASVDKDGVADVSRVEPDPDVLARHKARQQAGAAVRTGDR